MFTQIRSPSKLQTFQKFNSPTFEIINVSPIWCIFFSLLLCSILLIEISCQILINGSTPFLPAQSAKSISFLLMTIAATCIHPNGIVSEPHQRKPSFCIYAKTKVQISCMVTAFVFATLIVQPPLLPKSEISSL